MESNFNNREFEQYVKRNADQYRMIPSEKVWKGINNVLHTRRKWYGIGLTLLLLLTAVSVTWVMVSYPVSKMQAPVAALKSPANEITQPANTGQSATGSPLEKSISNLLSFNSKQENKTPFDESMTLPVDNNNLLPATESKPGEFIATTSPGLSSKANTGKIEPVSAGINTNTDKITSQDIALLPGIRVPEVNNLPLVTEKAYGKDQGIDYPLTVESVVNSYQAKKTSKRLIWQVYFMPTVSYRKLSENKSFQESSSSGTSNYPFATASGINQAVTHRSDMGLELGLSAKYPISKSLKLTGGLQFNINRYDIKAAYLYSGEQATISLNGGNGNDLVTTWTNYRNYNGSKSDWLKNFYFSVSAPVGAELKVLGNNKTYFGIAGTVQPTYMIGDKTYLISSDYKNYAEVPGLIRHVNVNTSFETFISYKSHSTRWQIGPQIRYQVLSSFKDKYPVRENLFDYGIKIGITLNP
ncbi:MAG: hypothetical protein Q8941_01060 [Bacteroidota bacterium]|nr:hypothetical protein [Bacteroidota bacterium]